MSDVNIKSNMNLSHVNNINPTKWGPAGWDFLYYISLAYPDYPSEKDKTNMKFFFSSIGDVLPCETCRYNFSKHIKKYPITGTATSGGRNVLDSRYSLIMWLININNEVNKTTNSKLIDYNYIINKYTMVPNNNNTIELYWKIGSIIMILFILLVLISIIKSKKLNLF